MATKMYTQYKIVRQVWWIKLDTGWYPLDADENVQTNGKTGCRGIICNNDGAWLKGFAKPLGKCTISIAELSGFLKASKWQKDQVAVE